MANKPFDQRIINQLERPTSSDLNLAQSQLNANVAFLLGTLSTTADWSDRTQFTGTGSLNRSFRVTPAGGMQLAMNWGLGVPFGSAVIPSVGGILGLNNINDVNFIYSSARTAALGNTITVPAGPGPGLFRKDVIAIRALTANEGLTDETLTDIYDPGTDAFSADSRYKTYTRDLASFPVTYVPYGTSIPSNASPIVYLYGPDQPYVFPSSLEVPTSVDAPNTWLNIAVINVVESPSSITDGDIIDYRRLIAPSGTVTIQGSATIGATGSSGIGAVLSDVSISSPAGIKACIAKTGANNVNTYVLLIFGARTILDASLSFSTQQGIGDTIGAYDPWTYTTRISLNARGINMLADSGMTAYVKSSLSSPTLDIAIGQPVHAFPFTLERIDVDPDNIAQKYHTFGYPAAEVFGTLSDGTPVRTVPITFTVTLRLQ